jgi:hypothetical protein
MSLAASLATILTVAGLGVAGSAYATTSDTILEWNSNAAVALFNAPTTGVPEAVQAPTVDVLHMTMVQGAICLLRGLSRLHLDRVPANALGWSRHHRAFLLGSGGRGSAERAGSWLPNSAIGVDETAHARSAMARAPPVEMSRTNCRRQGC